MKRDPLSFAESGDDAKVNAQHGQLSSLYTRWRKPLLRLFKGRLGNHAQAEDATQDVFVRMATSGKTLAAAEEEAYLRTTARNVSTDEWRRSGRGTGPDIVSIEEVAEDLVALPGDDQHSPLESAAHRQRLRRLNDAVSELPERQRQAFLLNRIDGLSHDEVAEAMGISTRMVAKHLTRAMAYCQLRVKYASVEQMGRLHIHEETDSESAAERQDIR